MGLCHKLGQLGKRLSSPPLPPRTKFIKVRVTVNTINRDRHTEKEFWRTVNTGFLLSNVFTFNELNLPLELNSFNLSIKDMTSKDIVFCILSLCQTDTERIITKLILKQMGNSVRYIDF